jgi:WD40 repeat protein
VIARTVADGKVEHQSDRYSGGPITALAASRDGKHLALTSDSTVWVTAQSKPGGGLLRGGGGVRTLVGGLGFGKNSDQLMAARSSGLVVTNVAAGFGDRVIASGEPLTGVSVAADSSVTAASSADGKLRLYDVLKYSEKAALKGHEGESTGVAVSLDGKAAVTGGIDGKVIVWDVAGEKVRHTLDHGEVVLSVAIACDGKLVASGGIDGSVVFWDSSAGKKMLSVPADGAVPAYSLAFAPDGKSLAVAEKDGTIRLWGTSEWKVRGEFRGPRERVTALAFGPDGQLFSGSVDATALAWDVRAAKPPADRK